MKAEGGNKTAKWLTDLALGVNLLGIAIPACSRDRHLIGCSRTRAYRDCYCTQACYDEQADAKK